MVASKPISIIMSSLVVLLDNPKAVRSPILHDKAVKLLLAMLGPQLDVQRRTAGSALGRTVMMTGGRGEWSPSCCYNVINLKYSDRLPLLHYGAGEAALVSAVLRTAAQQEGLMPALMRTYVSADFVVGLDVDKDSFDKFSMRSCIDMILEELWKDEPCRRSATACMQLGLCDWHLMLQDLISSS